MTMPPLYPIARTMELQRKLVRLDPNNAGYKAALLNLENMIFDSAAQCGQ